MTASNNNNNARKKQKITETVDNGGDSSFPIPVVVVPCSALSVGNIVKEFPDFLFCLLPYVGDRVIWNSIASSNKDVHEKSKAIQPPWPIYYKLPLGYNYRLHTWSPCGTRIACAIHSSTSIAIVDQRCGQLGPLRNNGDNNNNRPIWLAHDNDYISNLKFSPDGSFLVSTGNDGFVRLWDNTRNYEQLQEWNMWIGVVNGPLRIIVDVCVSTCSKYIAVSTRTCVFLKDVEDGGKTVSFIAPNENRIDINNIQFSADDRAIFICRDNGMIQVWHPHLDADDEDYLIVLARQPLYNSAQYTHTFSNDNTMVVIHDRKRSKGVLWSIDMEHKCLTHKSDFLAGNTGFCFTTDNKNIICNTKNGIKFWSIAKDEFTDHSMHGISSEYSEYNTHQSVRVESVSPNNRQLVVEDSRSNRNLYITSYSIL